MANPNISLLGATYSGVSGVTLPKSGGGTATFPWVEGSQTITQNNTYDVTNLAEVVVNVSGGGGGLEYETGIWEPAEDIARGTISFANTHTEAPIFFSISDCSDSTTIIASSNVENAYTDFYKITGYGIPYYSRYMRYATARSSFFTGTNLSNTNTLCGKNSDDPSATTDNYPRYWATETEFYPYSGSASRYWRAGRTYKWIAVWKPTS